MGHRIFWPSIVRDYENATLGWFDVIFPYAQRLFFGLVVLELIWSAAWWVFERDNPNSVIAALLYKVIAISFMFAILLHADAWIPAIANSFIEVGAAASGLAGTQSEYGVRARHKDRQPDS